MNVDYSDDFRAHYSGPTVPVGSLVEYHGSLNHYHGEAFEVVENDSHGIPGALTLTYLDSDIVAVSRVRPTSVTVIVLP